MACRPWVCALVLSAVMTSMSWSAESFRGCLKQTGGSWSLSWQVLPHPSRQCQVAGFGRGGPISTKSEARSLKWQSTVALSSLSMSLKALDLFANKSWAEGSRKDMSLGRERKHPLPRARASFWSGWQAERALLSLVFRSFFLHSPTAESFGVSAQIGSGVVRGGPEVRIHEGSTSVPRGSARGAGWCEH